MRMTSKGQVTIPKDVRDAIGVGPGSEIGFELHDGQATIVNLDARRSGSRGGDLVRHVLETATRLRLEGKINTRHSPDEMMVLLRGPHDESDAR
jgi:AbrB family looped-hinge helix DNA binding protein